MLFFNGKAPRIYLSWQECSKHVLSVRNAIYKMYSNYEQVVRDFQAAMRDVHPSHGVAPPLLILSLMILLLQSFLLLMVMVRLVGEKRC